MSQAQLQPNTKTSNKVGTKTEKLRLGGMDCGDCARSIEKSLQRLPGVVKADVSFGAATAEVAFEPDKVSREAIARRITEIGYTIEGNASPALSGMQFTIEGMDCADCALTVEKAVSAQSASVLPK